jgi:hypothetical protein
VFPVCPDFLRRFFAHLKMPLRPEPSAPYFRRDAFITVALLGLVALLEFLIVAKEQSFDWTFETLRQEATSHIKPMAHPVSQPLPETAVPVREEADRIEITDLKISQPKTESGTPARDVFSTEAALSWQSTNLGESTQPGSTMQMGETLIVQGSGTDMWKGFDRCRYVWMRASDDYAFSAQIKSIADNDGVAITGLLIKGAETALGPGLLFGFLGSGELFLQVRQPNNKTAIIKRSVRPVRLPGYLKIIRRGKAFEAWVSVDGRAWNLFAACELDLPSRNTLGFAVSAQVPGTLATAKFTSIRLLTPAAPPTPDMSLKW